MFIWRDKRQEPPYRHTKKLQKKHRKTAQITFEKFEKGCNLQWVRWGIKATPVCIYFTIIPTSELAWQEIVIITVVL